MQNYFFIQSQDPFTEKRTDVQFSLIAQLADEGKDVSVLLVQNGVTSAVTYAVCPEFDLLLSKNVKIYADKFSLEQREIDDAHLKQPIKSTDLQIVAEAMLNGDKVIWN